MLSKKMKKSLKKRLTMEESQFRSFGKVTDTPDGQLVHLDRGADILAVAHLDYVLSSRPKIMGDYVFAPQLDDRLGVWVLLDLLPTLAVEPYDVLLTTGEESGRSTARYFDPPRQYRYIFEFDRSGDDVVLYDFESDDLLSLCWQTGWTVGIGSYTDICNLQHLRCKALNIGTGYYNQHHSDCYADLQETIKQVKMFAKFQSILLTEHGDNVLAHTPVVYDRLDNVTNYRHNDYQRLIDDYQLVDDYRLVDDYCMICDGPLESGWAYCPFCGSRLKLSSLEYD